MKIYILPVSGQVQPSPTGKGYPRHNDDYGLEQDFLAYLQQNDDLVTSNPRKADFHCLPVFWSRLLNRMKGEILQEYVDQAILDDSKTFTVCQTFIWVKLGTTIVLQTSRSGRGIDLPLVSKPHQLPAQLPTKRYIASFVGSWNHPIRREMAECFKGLPDTCILGNKDMGEAFFVEKILESYITLCPRGTRGSSYRFYETLQLGGVPLFIGNRDTRPFKKFIHWDECSLFAETPMEALEIVRTSLKDDLLRMGACGAKVWQEQLTYGKWCGYAIEELRNFQSSGCSS